MQHTELTYPFATPEPGTFIEVAPGVRWIRLGLPFRLNHINVWSLDDGAGWTLVDTGVSTEESLAAWDKLLDQAPLTQPVRRVMVTHMHPDHIGMAGWFTRKYGVQLWISRLEYMTCRVVAADTGREAPAEALRFYAEAGWSPEAIDKYRARFGGFGKHIHALPATYKRLEDGMPVRIGAHDWEVVTGNGHSPEHACLYSRDLKILISGDQVLPRISSNVSVQPMEPEANPMADWLASLAKLRERVPDDVLVLPAHGGCFHGLHLRLQQLEEDQHASLARLRERLAEPRRVVDVFESLFKRPITEADASLLGMATGESLACLNWLVQSGGATRRVVDGVAWYERA
jgi:glyoxylase-like metal-dependent hydrolase (beta-lactamase superfamily II)